MQDMVEFYLPSFTSASALAGFTATKNTTLIIDASDGERVTLDIHNSPLKHFMTQHVDEAEVLISCYAKYRFLRIEQPTASQPKRKVWLKLLDPYHEFGEIKDLYLRAKNGAWSRLFAEISGQPHKARVMMEYFTPHSGWTLLHQAAWWGDQRAANTLMKLGVRVDRLTTAGDGGAGLTAEQVCNVRGSAIDWVEARAFA
eukprot:NODE_24752_length_612_cov_3.616495.p1 GENE.NODE_24752_length_612_cov_3.616495~~NODE_24752_length_612_cov_3.616495.p1  ORF type:complete len:200 (-),score=41.26 NODE_24752_length_612_cov_3.616495:13-612(-)